MPTPTRALTNNHNDCKLIKLGTSDPKSPLTVAQEGYAPSDATCRMRMFYLQRDGFWIDGIATQPAGFRAPLTQIAWVPPISTTTGAATVIGTDYGSVSGAAFGGVPEPTTTVLLAFGGLCFLCRRRESPIV